MYVIFFCLDFHFYIFIKIIIKFDLNKFVAPIYLPSILFAVQIMATRNMTVNFSNIFRSLFLY